MGVPGDCFDSASRALEHWESRCLDGTGETVPLFEVVWQDRADGLAGDQGEPPKARLA